MAAFKLTKKEAAELSELADAYSTARDALAERLDEIASKWEEALEERSDKWRESERGEEITALVEKVREWSDEMPDEGSPAVDVEEIS